MEAVAKSSLTKRQPKSRTLCLYNNKELAIVAAYITFFNI
jgi:hypothetical protein